MSSSRDPWLDNAKMTLVTLAVVGHAWSILLPASVTNDRLYDFLYVWHMPAFVLVSGYLSRSFDWSSRRLRATVATLVVPFVIYQAALVWFQVAIGGGTPEHPILQPVWPLWYLVALAIWRLAAPAFTRLPAGVAIASSFAISLLGGALDLSYLSLSKVLGLLPFFVLGLVATPERIERLRTPAAQQIGVMCLLLTLWVARNIDTFASTGWLYFRPYDVLGAGLLEGVAVRALLLALALGCSLGVLSLVPHADGWFTRMGSATMVVYLLHGFVVRGVDAAGLFGWATVHPMVGRVVLVASAVGLALALASPHAVRRLGPLVDPVGSWRGRTRTPVALPSTPGGGPQRAPRPAQVRAVDPAR